jgi:prolyl oligopeptidase
MSHDRSTRFVFAVALLCLTWHARGVAHDAAPEPHDENLWLEEIDSERALRWVEERNEATKRALTSHPTYSALFERLLANNDSSERIPYITQIGNRVYNFWRDAQHPKGVWRRTSMAEYRSAQPRWETVIDVDALATTERENWVWDDVTCLPRSESRCIVRLSRGGADASVAREFDLTTRTFVPKGFTLPATKSRLAWRDRDTLLAAADAGADSLTGAGYPRIVRQWRRGTRLDQSKLLFEGSPSDLDALAYRTFWPGFEREFIVRRMTPFRSEVFVNDARGLRRLDLPADATWAQLQDQLLINLRSPWQLQDRLYPAGTLLATDLHDFLAGRREFAVLFDAQPRTTLADYVPTRDHVILRVLDNLNPQLFALSRHAGTWRRERIQAPRSGDIGVIAADAYDSDDFLVSHSDFLTPNTLYLGTAGNESLQRLKQLPPLFDATGLEVAQHEACSRDGTRIPYFQVSRAGLKLDGTQPTLMYGYGGFGVSQLPDYDATLGSAWLERGGVYVLANIRGGGEFGSQWHEMAVGHERQRSYDDFIAVAEDLIRRRVTSPRHLGVMGVSNGGLLAGVMLTQRPDLFGAIVSRSPLLDMRRYHRLLAGASWLSEYGNPDQPLDWSYIARYSPYHNIRKGVRYPKTLITTSTRDDRVHPAHARKMAARMSQAGHDVLYAESTDGGHFGAADNRQRAALNALIYTFVLRELGSDADPQLRSGR